MIVLPAELKIHGGASSGSPLLRPCAMRERAACVLQPAPAVGSPRPALVPPKIVVVQSARASSSSKAKFLLGQLWVPVLDFVTTPHLPASNPPPPPPSASAPCSPFQPPATAAGMPLVRIAAAAARPALRSSATRAAPRVLAARVAVRKYSDAHEETFEEFSER